MLVYAGERGNNVTYKTRTQWKAVAGFEHSRPADESEHGFLEDKEKRNSRTRIAGGGKPTVEMYQMRPTVMRVANIDKGEKGSGHKSVIERADIERAGIERAGIERASMGRASIGSSSIGSSSIGRSSISRAGIGGTCTCGADVSRVTIDHASIDRIDSRPSTRCRCTHRMDIVASWSAFSAMASNLTARNLHRHSPQTTTSKP